ncbi:iron-sulfur cluster-binding protein [Desulfocucumis palustris]|uniref:Iron-sulfur cluster-binding protein n=1 Tax=Desulfocucumis palustris TaxID=1898651 RepID=A0A2L2X735_9FIRM|nr:4Fe-4S dicluster domain-containing protein [Desulfocucumis palustris]GBF31878.1 iron-sulfur cluster-binding protein [Desulfocucumis palustris]
MKLAFEAEKCIGCRLCHLACSGVKENIFNPSLSRLKVASEYLNGGLVITASLCSGCLSCAEACPTGAISGENGVPVVDADICTGCGECANACPEGVIVMPPDGRPRLCDFCGGEPVCVQWCPQGALTAEV